MSRGGARPGAGRPEKADKRVTVTCRVQPETREVLRQMRKEGIGAGVILDSAARAWMEQKLRESK